MADEDRRAAAEGMGLIHSGLSLLFAHLPKIGDGEAFRQYRKIESVASAGMHRIRRRVGIPHQAARRDRW
jgi:hypothetical protein